MSAIKITKLRADIYNIIDNVLKTGAPVEIERKGKIVKISLVENKKKKGSIFDRLQKHPKAIIGDPEDFAHIDWSKEWKHDIS